MVKEKAMKITTHDGAVSFVDGKFRLGVKFHRTIRLPEDGKTHALPPNLGEFPVRLVDDFKDKVPADWVEHGGVFLPMHPREAMWMSFHGSTGAIKVAAGKINAVSGKPWDPKLKAPNKRRKGEQDYMVGPKPQPWIDGFNAGDGVIKQFVGMALGQGYTVEGQVTGEEKFGGIQVLVCPPKEKERERVNPPSRGGLIMGGGVSKAMDFGGGGEVKTSGMMLGDTQCMYSSSDPVLRSASFATKSIGAASTRKRASQKGSQIGMAAGGSMKQKIYPDPFGVAVWDQAKSGRLYVHIINAEMYQEITGVYPPELPATAQEYEGPWFDINDGHAGDVPASETLAGVSTVAEKDEEHGFEGQQDDTEIDESDQVHTYDMPPGTVPVRNGKW
jgi:hypothetical protein